MEFRTVGAVNYEAILFSSDKVSNSKYVFAYGPSLRRGMFADRGLSATALRQERANLATVKILARTYILIS